MARWSVMDDATSNPASQFLKNAGPTGAATSRGRVAQRRVASRLYKYLRNPPTLLRRFVSAPLAAVCRPDSRVLPPSNVTFVDHKLYRDAPVNAAALRYHLYLRYPHTCLPTYWLLPTYLRVGSRATHLPIGISIR